MFIHFIDKRKKEIFFIILLLIFFYRSPFIFLNGRFMAEEGQIFFANAYRYSFIYSLFYVDFISGYLNLWANLSGIVSNFFELNLAPLISNYLSLFPKILIIFHILYSKSIFTEKNWQKIILCMIIFLCPQNVPEIWMNSINSQIFFCILAFILLNIDYQKNEIKYSHLMLILISGLSGIYSCILTPVFFFKYYIFKKSQDLLNFIIIISCSIIQLSLIFYSKFSGILYSGKLHSVNLDLIFNFIYNVVVKTFLGSNLTKSIYYSFESNLLIISLSLLFILSFLIFFLYVFLKSFLRFNIQNKFISISLIFAFISTSLIVLIGAVSEYVGGRYAAIPSFYLLCIILFMISKSMNNYLKIILIILLISSNISGIFQFRPLEKNISHYHHTLKNLDCIECPNWPEEVKKFKEDNDYELKIWPYPIKSMLLN